MSVKEHFNATGGYWWRQLLALVRLCGVKGNRYLLAAQALGLARMKKRGKKGMQRKQSELKPLELRTFRFKNPAVEFFCPLCRTGRAITVHYKLTVLHCAQIVAVATVFTALLWPLMGARSLFSFFLVWIAFEGTLRLLWRKEVPCPHCGFDASWYKKNVKIARKKVEEFWNSQDPAQ